MGPHATCPGHMPGRIGTARIMGRMSGPRRIGTARMPGPRRIASLARAPAPHPVSREGTAGRQERLSEARRWSAETVKRRKEQRGSDYSRRQRCRGAEGAQ